MLWQLSHNRVHPILCLLTIDVNARLAYHFGEAAVMGETERAVRYAREAAQQALDLARVRVRVGTADQRGVEQQTIAAAREAAATLV